MKEKLRSLPHHITSDPHLLIAIVIAGVIMLMETLYWIKLLHEEVPTNAFLFVIMVCIIALVMDRLKESDQIRDDTEKLGRIYLSTFDKRIALQRRPEKREEYDYLWGGYTGRYYVYNPAYKVGIDMGEEEIVNIFLHRYQDSSFVKAQFLFLTGDKPGQDALKTFRQLMTVVKQKYPNVDDKIEVKEMKNKEAVSAPEMCLGTRHERPIGVLELKGPTATPQHGTSHYYLVIHNKDVVEHYIGEHFKPAWDDDNAEDVEHFWE